MEIATPSNALPLQPKVEPTDSSTPIPKTLTPPPPIPILSPPIFLPQNLSDEQRRLALHLQKPNPKPNPSSSIVPANFKKRKPQPRSSDLQRVSSITPDQDLEARSFTRRTRILYESIRIHLIQQQPPQSPIADGRRSRPDLDAGTLMADAGLWLNRDRRTVGFIPGTRIGDVSFFRMELCVLGLHGHLQAGIDFVAAGEPIATSIVFSGGYEDDEDRGEVIFYTGQGGRQGKHARKQSVGQELKGGNLALERSCNYGIEVRVIRGLDCERSPTKRVYVYDGLYRVVECLSEIGKSGFVVFKFKLVRIEGQEVMGSSAIKLAEELKRNALGVRPNGYLSLDISQGKEKEPVAVFNDVDSNCDPLLCEYLVSPEFDSFVRKPGGRGCKCQSVCSVGCVCANRNGGEFAYDLYGRLLKGKPLVYECGRYCGCPPSCVNRVSQKGLRHQLEIFRSSEGRWAVRSLDIILAGEFVCEFSGSLFAMEQLELEARNGLILVDPNRLPRRWGEWGDLSMVISDYEKPKFPSLPHVGYFVDVLRARNVACYMSHSSSPNCFVQFVLVDHYNVAYPHLMIFAMENIPPMRELSLDYGFGDV